MLGQLKLAVIGLTATSLLLGCAENPDLSYSDAQTEQECHDRYNAELKAWKELRAPSNGETPASETITALFSSAGILTTEETLLRRLRICETRIAREIYISQQPGVAGCRMGGGVMQRGTLICPGF